MEVVVKLSLPCETNEEFLAVKLTESIVKWQNKE